jgi:hypothetical protein
VIELTLHASQDYLALQYKRSGRLGRDLGQNLGSRQRTKDQNNRENLHAQLSGARL